MVDAIIEKEASILVTLVPNELVDDNPYNSRQKYSEDEIKSMAESIKQNGLLEAPEGRRTQDGRVQIAFGHKRLRAYRSIAESVSAEKWKRFPVFIVELTDTQMLDKAIEENLQRSNVTPMEVARALAKFSEAHPDVKDKDIAKKHGMSDSQISNMKRVLRLPTVFLEMIDLGDLSFTEGRELLTLGGLPNEEGMMMAAITARAQNSLPHTVEGLKKAIQIVNPTQKKGVIHDPAAQSSAPGASEALADYNKTNQEAEQTKAPENISQEKLVTEPEAKATETAQTETKTPETVTNAAQSETKSTIRPARTMLLEENGKRVNISFSTAKGGLIIRGVLGNLDTVCAYLPAILEEMMAETKGGKK
ncbi:MAG: ParB/RepB/Spo0J family partition protein [Dehalococcoidales bacterium]|nr:ParB/RepB/Spo0J family partition protein [Dehalococcoidales bacterium]